MDDDFYDPMSGLPMGGDDYYSDVSYTQDPLEGEYYDEGLDAGGSNGFGGGLGKLIPTQFSTGPNMIAQNPRVGGRMAGAAGALIVAGRKVAGRKVWEAVKKFGVQLTAGALGYSAIDLVTYLINSRAYAPRRRRRGISSRDVRTARRVVRFVNRMQHDIGCVTRRGGGGYYRRGRASASARAG